MGGGVQIDWPVYTVESELKVKFLNILDFLHKTNYVYEFNETVLNRHHLFNNHVNCFELVESE